MITRKDSVARRRVGKRLDMPPGGEAQLPTPSGLARFTTQLDNADLL